ncbi:chemokine-like receptor 1 [Lates japonicus]|uniref:Chemokine-like receptor 1 n=1 Tax=Lates japonicus TaxID=270547 RepID=A0AAD3RKP1_LATJO|nr:chemokine-like receptor 1 [Lates japonicus]
MVSCVILGVWVLALIFSAPYFIFRDTEHDHDEDITICFDNFALSDDNETSLGQFRHQAMAITRFLLGFVVPFTVIVSCYAVIIHRVRRSDPGQPARSGPLKSLLLSPPFFLCYPYHIMKSN